MGPQQVLMAHVTNINLNADKHEVQLQIGSLLEAGEPA